MFDVANKAATIFPLIAPHARVEFIFTYYIQIIA